MGTHYVDEPALWELARAGDSAAFAMLFDKHRDRVFGHALRSMRPPHDAEDVTAMVFLELWRRRKAVTLVNETLIGWLLVTTNNRLGEVVIAGATPGKTSFDQTGDGQLVLLSRDAAELIDGATGATIWKTATADCGFQADGIGADIARQGIGDDSVTVIEYGDPTLSCHVDSSGVVPVKNAPIDARTRYDFGTSHRYQLLDGQLSAVDLGTGGIVWTVDSAANGVLFAGGYLVTKEGETLRSVG
jgi:hypothetical protein